MLRLFRLNQTMSYNGCNARVLRYRDRIAPRRRSWRWLIRRTKASRPSALRGRISLRISTMSRELSRSTSHHARRGARR